MLPLTKVGIIVVKTTNLHQLS